MEFPSDLFPEGIVAELLDIRQGQEALFPEEAIAVRRAVGSRRAEYVAGRTAARRALKRLGAPPGPIPQGLFREPVWPEGVCGSLSHDRDLCGAVVAWKSDWRSLGLDLESAEPLQPDLVDRICATGELDRLTPGNPRPVCGWPKTVFSAKESIFKCLYPVVKNYFDFHDVRLAPGGVEFEFQVLPGVNPPADGAVLRSLTVQVRFMTGRVVASCRLPGPN